MARDFATITWPSPTIARLAAERAKLVFLTGDALADAIAQGDDRPAHEVVLFIPETTASLNPLLASRDAAGLATFVTARSPIADLERWRLVDLTPGPGSARQAPRPVQAPQCHTQSVAGTP